ncbi:MAG: nucleotidyl transferase AbiEii/AbiGii toxin family protein [Thermoanaerobaculia bacterium]
MKKPVTNFGASVRARLHDLTRTRNGDFQFTLQRYVAERFLYRLGVSPHRERFVLKGAMLFVLWGESVIRPTRDLDLAGYWANDATSCHRWVRCAVAVRFALSLERIGSPPSGHPVPRRPRLWSRSHRDNRSDPSAMGP